MNIVGAIIAGLAGTAAMTLLMYVAPLLGMPKMDIMRMLGSMFTSARGVATGQGTVSGSDQALTLGLGSMIHLMMGAVFGLIYALLWSLGIGSATWIWGLIFGALHGVMAIGMMPLMMRMHPNPPQMAGGPLVMAGQLMGHMVYGLVVALVYSAF